MLTQTLIWWRFNTVVVPRRKESSRPLSHLCGEFLVCPKATAVRRFIAVYAMTAIARAQVLQLDESFN